MIGKMYSLRTKAEQQSIDQKEKFEKNTLSKVVWLGKNKTVSNAMK